MLFSAQFAENKVVILRTESETSAVPTYIHEQKSWTRFKRDDARLAPLLAQVRHKQGRLVGQMEGLGFQLRREALLQTLTQDVLKSSEIEGEILDREQVRSSIARRLGIDIGALTPADRNVEGVVEMMLDATQNYAEPLTKERLFSWHASLFPGGYSGLQKIRVGGWRKDEDGPMQVVSGRIGREKVHYEAPAAKRVARNMQSFLKWFNDGQPIDPVVKAAIAHLWFVTIHPFEDGNGRIARAIADMALARSDDSAQRFYSMSTQLRADRRDYYDMLEKTQKRVRSVTDWVAWFLECLDRSFDHSSGVLENVLAKSTFWQKHQDSELNDRQRDMINRLFTGFEGKLTSSKWAKIQKCSQDTASRDIADLIERGILVKNPGGGRSTSYSLVRE